MGFIKNSVFSIVLFSLALSSCKDKDKPDPVPEPVDQLKVLVMPAYGAEDLMLDQSYITDEGYQIQFTDLKFYISDVQFGSKLLARTGLFDFRERGTLLFSTEGKPADFPSFSGLLGVPEIRNHADPVAYPSTDPLHIAVANDMHWGWNPGYIFVKVEAKVDTIPNGIDLFDHYVVLHVGGDIYTRNLEFLDLNWTTGSNKVHTTKLKLDMKHFLNTGTSAIDLKTEFTSHTAPGQEVLSTKVIEHFKQALGKY
jgi:hypothetical protein